MMETPTEGLLHLDSSYYCPLYFRDKTRDQ
jgi:hypothetical protein